MIELSVNGLSKFYGANKLFENISFEIKTGERIGLIGQNGCGKTTIMKILMGREDYQTGEISLKKGNRIGYLDQIPNYGEAFSVSDVLKTAFEQVNALKMQMEELEERMTYLTGDELDRAVGQYARIRLNQNTVGRSGKMVLEVKELSKSFHGQRLLTEVSFQLLYQDSACIIGKMGVENPPFLS